MKKQLTKKVLSVLTAALLLVSAVPWASALADGKFGYEIFNGEAIIRSCDTFAQGEVTIPSVIEGCPVTTIASNAFSNCSRITAVTVPDSVTTIESEPFYQCSQLSRVTFGSGVQTFGGNLFIYCLNVAELTVSADNPYYCSDSDGVLYNKDKTKLVFYPAGRAGTTYTVCDSVTAIGQYAFYDNANLAAVELPDGLTAIEAHAFENTRSLTGITIPDGVTTLADYLFNNSDNLEHVVVPSDITSIGKYAFASCRSLRGFVIPDSVTKIDDFAFKSTYIGDMPIPDSVTHMGDGVFSGSGVVNVTLPSGLTAITKNMFSFCNLLESITIPDGCLSIGDLAFNECPKLESVAIPDTVTSIGYAAFEKCALLTDITLPSKLTTIGEKCFWGCESITEITVPNGVVTIPANAFFECTGLTSVTISQNVTAICSSAFSHCTALPSVVIPGSVRAIGAFAFSNCDSLESVTLGEGTLIINDLAFSYCVSLAQITIPSSVTSISDNAFDTCVKLESITVAPGNTSYSSDSFGVLYNADKTTLIQYPANALRSTYTVPNTVTEISKNAFRYSANLTAISLPESLQAVGQFAFNSCNSLSDVYYAGSEEAWANVTVSPWGNDELTGAAFHFSQASIPTVEVFDSQTGAAISFTDGTYNGEVELDIDEVESGLSVQLAQAIDNAVKSIVYSIETLVDGISVQPDGSVTVRLPIPEGFNPELIELYYINTALNKAEKVDFTLVGNYIVFTTDHFSHWSVVETQVQLTSIEIKAEPAKTQYSFREDVSTQGIRVVAKYSDGSEADVTDEITVKDFSAAQRGSHTATVEFGGKTASFSYTVKYTWWQWIIKIVLFGWIWYN